MFINREKILRQLAHVHNQAAEGDGSIARHRKAVAELERDGQDASLARKMLAYAEHVQKMNSADGSDWNRFWARESSNLKK